MLKKRHLRHPILFLVFLTVSNITYSQTERDSLKSVWRNNKEVDSTRFKSLETYYTTYNQTQPDSVLKALDYHYILAEEKRAINQMFNAKKRKGNIHRLKGNYNKAMSAYEAAEDLAIQLNDSLLQAQIMGNKGNVFIYRQDYKQATQHFSNALKTYQETGNAKGESHMLTSLGSVYLIIHNYDLALEYYKKALSILNKRGFEDRRTAIIFINLGWTNFEKENYLEAKKYYEKGLKILKVKNENFFIASCYSTLARIHHKLNQLEQANLYAQKNLELNTKLDIKDGIINAEIIIAQLTFESNVNDATTKAEAILADLPPKMNKEIKRDLYELLYKCYKSQNKLGQSLKMYENYTIYNDSIQQEKNNFAVAREAVKNEFEVKLYENKLKSEKDKAQLKVEQLKRTFGLISVSVLLITCIVFYYRKNIKKNREKRDALLQEIESLKNNSSSELVIDSNKFELIREKIEHSIDRKLNETDWNVLNILLEQPEISNKQIAEKAFMSVDGIGSSLRRMYDYFEVKETKYKKISLLTDAIKRSNN